MADRDTNHGSVDALAELREMDAMRRTLESLRQQIQDGAIAGVEVRAPLAPRRPSWLPAAWIASLGAAAVLAVLATRPSASEVRTAPPPPAVEDPAQARPKPAPSSTAPMKTASAPAATAPTNARPPRPPRPGAPVRPARPPAVTTPTPSPSDEEDPLYGIDLDGAHDKRGHR